MGGESYGSQRFLQEDTLPRAHSVKTQRDSAEFEVLAEDIQWNHPPPLNPSPHSDPKSTSTDGTCCWTATVCTNSEIPFWRRSKFLRFRTCSPSCTTDYPGSLWRWWRDCHSRWNSPTRRGGFHRRSMTHWRSPRGPQFARGGSHSNKSWNWNQWGTGGRRFRGGRPPRRGRRWRNLDWRERCCRPILGRNWGGWAESDLKGERKT